MLRTPYTHCKTPSAGLSLQQITGDKTLIREFVARARIERKAIEQLADDRSVAAHPFYVMILTCTEGKAGVSLNGMLAEIQQRAQNGSHVATGFLNALNKFHGTQGGNPLTAINALDISRIVHAFIKSETLPASMKTYSDGHNPRNLEVDAPRKKSDPAPAINWGLVAK